jgi:hypothetical protein
MFAPLVCLASLLAAEPAPVAGAAPGGRALPPISEPAPTPSGAPERGTGPAVRGPAPDVAVVCPPIFRETLTPWLEHRAGQGHLAVFVDSTLEPEEIKKRLQALFKAEPRLSVVLVGDAEPAAAFDRHVRARCVPTHHSEAKVNVLFGSEPMIAGDNWYADFDDDGLPEVPIGRMPVDTRSELARLVGRIIEYENSADFGLWRRRINFIAGIGNFGALADAALEGAAKTLLTRYLPPALESTMTYASWQSPYCPGLPLFQRTAIGRFNEGCLMWVYIGHGLPREVDRVPAPEGSYPILRAADVPALRARRTPPLAVFLSCYTGAFDGREDCLAEEMLRSEGGPISVLAGSRVTLPYAMSVLGQELMVATFQERHLTLGRVLFTAKRASVTRPRDTLESRQYDAIAATLMPMSADLTAQRREHVDLFNLLGDPLLRIPQPNDIKLSAPSDARAGETIKVSGKSPIGGRAVIEFVVRRDRLVAAPPAREGYDGSPAGLAEFATTYARANDSRLAAEEIELAPGEFTLSIGVPAEAKGECHVRVYVEGAEGYGLGSADVKVRAASRISTVLRTDSPRAP